MMITFMEPKEKVKEVDKCLDSQLWHACAGGMVQMPAVGSKVYYFPQGHAEHSSGPVDFRALPRMPPYVLCKVVSVRFMADPDTDDVFSKMRLAPVSGSQGAGSDEEEEGLLNGKEMQESKPSSFAKTLTQSDANNGGGFSVPRYCAETIFPPLDYSADPPVQTILVKDVHGETWKFRHIYRGTPRRHLLTTGWSTFVNHKKLVAGDSIVFLRADNDDLCVGIRRAKRGIGGGLEPSWNPAGGNYVTPYGGFAAFLRDDENKLTSNRNGNVTNDGMIDRGKVRPESVIEAATLAAKGQPFEVVYYPRASTPEFCVKSSLVKSAFQIQWCSGMRFKMAFETEDSSRISWFMGTISSAQVSDPLCWPESPWRLLQVNWDEPDLLQNVKRVSPWLVQMVSNMPAIHLSPSSPPRKKLRMPHNLDFPLNPHFPMPAFPGNLLGHSRPFGCLPENSPASMQGARHAHYCLPIPDFHLNKMQAGLFPAGFSPRFDHAAAFNRISHGPINSNPSLDENVSCVLTMGRSARTSKRSDDAKSSQLVLFGKKILTEEQISLSCSGDMGNSSSDGNIEKMAIFSDSSVSALHIQGLHDRLPQEVFRWYKNNRQETKNSSEMGHCKFFMESEDISGTLDLTSVGSYEELRRKLTNMFSIQNPDFFGNLLYHDANGTAKHIGDEPFSEFVRMARKLTIPTDSRNNNVGHWQCRGRSADV